MADLHAATVRAWPPVTRYVPGHWTSRATTAVDGTALHSLDTGGDGPPVVLLHGVQVDGLTWARTALAIKADHRVIMPDLRGHGRSGRVRGVAAFADHWRGGEHVHVPDSGHAVQFEQLDRFVELLTGSLARCRTDGRGDTA